MRLRHMFRARIRQLQRARHRARLREHRAERFRVVGRSAPDRDLRPPRRHHALPSAATTASPIARVPTTASPGQRDVAGAQTQLQHAADGALDPVRDVGARERVAEHHRERQDRRQRIRLVLPRDVRRGPVDRLVEALLPRVERRGGQHADRPREHRRLVGQDVAEDVAGDDHVELLRVASRAASPRCRRTCATARRPGTPPRAPSPSRARGCSCRARWPCRRSRACGRACGRSRSRRARSGSTSGTL